MIIQPGQEHLSREQLAAAAQRQQILVVVSKWKEFTDSTAEAASETFIGKELSKHPKADTIVPLIWHGAQTIKEEQLIGVGAGQIDEETMHMVVADVMSNFIAILMDPRATNNAQFRAFALAAQLGVISFAPKEEDISDIPPRQ